MPRQIKFRVWDNKRKRMLLPAKEGLIHATASGYLSLFQPLHDSDIRDSMGGWPSPYNEDIIIEQFTGLLDYDGKEIYEGDILEFEVIGYEAPDLPSRVTTTHQEVSWEDMGWNINNNQWFSKGKSQYYKVVGNIHQNPELLKQ